MKKFITFIYRATLMGFMVLGVLYLAELLPFQNDEEENASGAVVTEVDVQEDVLAPAETTEASAIATPTPTPIPEPTDREVLQLISDSVVTNSEGYEVTYGDAYNVFAEQTSDVFSFRTLVWYNMWGHNEQEVCFNAQKLTALGDIFHFKAGLEDGGSGTVTLSIYLDGDTENPAYEYTLDASLPPVDVAVDIRDTSSMKIVVENHAGDQNRIVCYDFNFVNEEVELA